MHHGKLAFRLRAGLVAFALIGFTTIPAIAETPVEFFDGKTVTILIGGSPGGSHNFYSNLLHPYVSKYLPGHPSFIVKNMGGGGGMMGGGMMGGGMMGPGQGRGYEEQPFQTQGQGAEVFRVECSRCHAQGGNVIYPNLPLKGAPQLTDFDTFLAYIRNPAMPDGAHGPMPAYPLDRISDDQARNLYQYLVTVLGSPAQGGPGAGYGMGPGYGMRPGYGGQYAPSYQKPSKPLDEQQARQEVEKYLKSTRNPNLKVGKIEDKGNQFEVTVETNEGSLVDKILVEKNTGRMKSAY